MATVRVRVAAAMFEYSDIGIMACCQGTAPAWQLANEMPAELHSNGTTRRVDRSHGDRDHRDRSTLPRLQELWHLRQGKTNITQVALAYLGVSSNQA
jgi:hypothetical protein